MASVAFASLSSVTIAMRRVVPSFSLRHQCEAKRSERKPFNLVHGPERLEEGVDLLVGGCGGEVGDVEEAGGGVQMDAGGDGLVALEGGSDVLLAEESLARSPQGGGGGTSSGVFAGVID
jgi:hypothetical protein